MTALRVVDPARVLTQALGNASPDLMRHLLGTMISALLGAEGDAVCGAEWGQPSPALIGSLSATATGIANSTPWSTRSMSRSRTWSRCYPIPHNFISLIDLFRPSDPVGSWSAASPGPWGRCRNTGRLPRPDQPGPGDGCQKVGIEPCYRPG